MTNHSMNTPSYVLLDGTRRLGPMLLPADSESESRAIYGFSDKPPYDLFCANTELALTPYPLVKGYLRNQIADSDHGIQLVVVDAAGPDDAELFAATMKSVLEAQEQKAERVPISFRLILDQASRGYRIEKLCSDVDVASSPPAPQTTLRS
jgi:hypothetical protein